MTITEASLRLLVGEELGIVTGNMPLDADVDDKIARRALSVRNWLLEEGLVYWASGAIPEAAALPYAQIVAGQCAEIFGRGPNSEDPYKLGQSGFEALQRHTSKRSAREPVQATYF